MKKILLIGSLLTVMTAVFTGCGNGKGMNEADEGSYYEEYDYNNGSYDRTDTTSATNNRNSAGDHVDDAIDGAKDAGKDIADGVGDAAKDIIDGFDGKKESDSTKNTNKKR